MLYPHFIEYISNLMYIKLLLSGIDFSYDLNFSPLIGRICKKAVKGRGEG